MSLTVLDRNGISAARRKRIAASGVLIAGPRGFERTVVFGFDEAPQAHRTPRGAQSPGRRAEEAAGGWPERRGGGGDASAYERRQEEAVPDPRRPRADQRGDEAAVTGADISRAGESDGWRLSRT
jgi:hypothetical protein